MGKDRSLAEYDVFREMFTVIRSIFYSFHVFMDMRWKHDIPVGLSDGDRDRIHQWVWRTVFESTEVDAYH